MGAAGSVRETSSRCSRPSNASRRDGETWYELLLQARTDSAQAPYPVPSTRRLSVSRGADGASRVLGLEVPSLPSSSAHSGFENRRQLSGGRLTRRAGTAASSIAE